ncbi:MAG TPA: lysophospholipid acyltransferase family protein [Terriglobia bacterium]|nr:lysophospholipid acyltransferase family protein [Terriglobia bacterium]
MIRSACVVCFALLYIFVVGAPLLVYTLLSGNTDLIYRAGVLGATMTVHLAGARLEVVGLEKIERTRAVVFMANHQSNCDPPALIGLLPPVLILGKQEFFRVPILGLAMRLRGFIPVDRRSREKSIQAINHAADSLNAGRSFLTFPEGTRSTDGRLLPFKKGVFIMAMKAGVPIQPVSISGSRKVMPKGKVAMRAGKVRITFHDLLATTGTTEISAYQDAVRKAILSGLAEEEWPANLKR